METNKYSLRNATIKDIPELLTLYFKIYGKGYPLAMGTDEAYMMRLMSDPQNIWLLGVTTENNKEKICGSMLFEVDLDYKIARALGLVTHPDHQKKGLASSILEEGSRRLLNDQRTVNSIYTTTRTLSLGPQLIFLRENYLPLGIFPNIHRVSNYETLTLFAKFHPDALKNRRQINEAPEALGPILKAIDKFAKSEHPFPKLLKTVKPKPCGEVVEFELILAPEFVKRKFFKTFTDPFDRFYPFHCPNLLITAMNGEIDIYAYFNPADGYCTIIALTQPISTLAGRMRPLLQMLRDFGVSYIEIMLEVDSILSLEALLDVQFLPSALYPGMLEMGDESVDLVLMSRTLEPLNFRGMSIEKSFKPYIDQYVDLWKKMYLEVLGVFDEK